MLRRCSSMAAGSPKPLRVTFAPSAAKARATARPIPDVEPVTTTDFPRIIRLPPFLRTWGRPNRVSRGAPHAIILPYGRGGEREDLAFRGYQSEGAPARLCARWAARRHR